jgi:hypothetical protein
MKTKWIEDGGDGEEGRGFENEQAGRLYVLRRGFSLVAGEDSLTPSTSIPSQVMLATHTSDSQLHAIYNLVTVLSCASFVSRLFPS